MNQDLDGDNKIWSISSESLSQVDTDTRGAKLYTDSDNNLYVQAAGASQKSQLLDDGRPLNLSYSFTDGDYTYSESPVAVDAIDLDSNGANDAYRLLVRQKEVDGSTIESSYYSVNADLTTLKVDWGSYSFYESAEAMEAAFDMDLDGDGSVFTIDSNKSTEVATDTTGAKLRTQNGNLFVKDGDTTIPIVGKNDGAPVMLNDSWTKVESDSTTTFKSEPIAVQKVTGTTTYKLVVKEVTTYSQGIGVETSLVPDENVDVKSNSLYSVYDISAAGALDRSSVVFHTAAELNETVFNQDITGDGPVSQGSSTDTHKDKVSTTVKQEIKDQYQSQASSDMIGVQTSLVADENTAQVGWVPWLLIARSSWKISLPLSVKRVQIPQQILSSRSSRFSRLMKRSC